MLNSVIEKISKQVVPSKKIQNEKKEIANTVIDLVRKEIASLSEAVDVEIGGSYAKGTWLAEKADVDLFVKFKENTSDKKFRELGEKIGFGALKKFKPYIRYSEHPYVEASVRGTKVNVVPCYNVKEGKWKSAADRSQFHTKFMRSKLSEKKQNEVRILKQFLKANGIYGAEISKQGFSGYISEVLIWNLGSFNKVLEKFAKIKEFDVIGKATKEFDTIITIVDPIDGNRNLAAAISNENISKFILTARAFLKKPSLEFFKAKKYKMTKSVLDQIVTIEFEYSKRSPDVIWGQIKKASTSLATQLGVEGFNVVRNSAISNEKNNALLIFLVESLDISKKQVKEGPEIFKENDSASFVAKNLKKSQIMWVNKDKKILSLENREFSNVGKFLQNLLTVKINRSGIPKGLRADFKHGFKISVGGKGLRKSIKEELSEFVTTDEKIFSVR